MAGQVSALTRDEDQAPWGILVDTAEIPGGGRLQLYRNGPDFEILLGEQQLMGSWAVHSEQALAERAADHLGHPAARVLIGGLGMGFTLAAARKAFAASAAIVVAELVPQVVAWARGALADIVGDSLNDRRVTIEIADVHDVIEANQATFDAILLDVDNGPDGLVILANERLYCAWGLRAAHAALTLGGVLAVWSAYPDQAFGDRLREAGFDVDVLTLGSGGHHSEPPHVIWLATKTRATEGSGKR